MKNPVRFLHTPGSYVLSKHQYDGLLDIREKLLMFGSLARTDSAMQPQAVLIPLTVLEDLFCGLALQMDDVLENLAQAPERKWSRGELAH